MSEGTLKRTIFIKLAAVFSGFMVLFTWQFMNFSIPFEDYVMSVATAGCLFAGLAFGLRGSLLVALLLLFGYGTTKIVMVLWLQQPILIGVNQLFWLLAVPAAAFVSGSLHQSVYGVIEKLDSLNTEIEGLVAVDEMTGLDNAKRFAFRVVEEISRCRRYGGEFSLVLVKIAFLEELENVHGLRVQKLVIQKFAEALKSVKRFEDFLSRIGRDEFSLVVPNTTREGVEILKARIREHLPYLDISPVGEESRRIPLTIRIGTAAFPEDGEEYIPLLNFARNGYGNGQC